MDVSQTNENELQKAIDDITKGAATDANSVNALETQIQTQMGVPPVPPVPETPAAPMVEVPPLMPEAPTVTESTAEPAPIMAGASVTDEGATVGPEPAVAPTAEPADTSGDLDSVKGAIVRDLYGLLDVVEAQPEEKFKVIQEMIESTGDKSMIVKGYDAAKGIADEKAKAEALLFLFENA